jgi:hypothetical protein
MDGRGLRTRIKTLARTHVWPQVKEATVDRSTQWAGGSALPR